MLDHFSVIGDPHITPDSIAKGTQLFEYVESRGLPTIWLGDFLDTKEIIRGKCQNLIFNYFSTSKLQHIVIVGNHDLFNLDGEDHSLRVLTSLPNVTVIDTVRKHPTLPFVFFPYIHDKAKLRAELIKYSGQDLIAFGHFEVSGFDFGNGTMCDDGVITISDFAGYKRVVSGHFHKLQQIDNLTYPGTPFSHSFGEANQDKVVGEYRLSTNDLTLLATNFPRHISHKMEFSKPNFKKKLNDFLEGNENNIIRVQMYGPADKVAAFDDDKSEYKNFDIKWEDKSDDPISNNVTIDESLTNKAQFQEWASNIKKLDPETMKLGLEILEAVGAK